MNFTLVTPSAQGRRARSQGARLFLLLATTLGLGACGTYEEPKPGVYLGMGKTESELTCEYGAQTAMRVSTWRCRRTDTLSEEERQAKEFLESRRVHQPRDP